MCGPHRHKSELTCYVLVARRDPLLCFYHDGYMTLQHYAYTPPHVSHPSPLLGGMHGRSGTGTGIGTVTTSRQDDIVWSFDEVCACVRVVVGWGVFAVLNVVV